MEIKFRLMRVDDLAEVVELCNECFGENNSVTYAKENFDENSKTQIYLIGEVDGKIVAHTLINILPTCFEEMGSYAILNHVCVKPEYRRHGFGAAMMQKCFEICAERGCKMVKLWSKNFRKPAHAMYYKYGFEAIDATFFEKDLGGKNENQ